ncbi:acyl carrier protein [Kitasatospora sp. NPDC101235]|uniref:acyl carrier protein n=1 Tax=Kitasatospora sp. NPDC101235 TaxID=3364101 RepID=UPI0037FAC48D
MNATLDELRSILTELGVPEDELTPGCRLRSGLGLDSTETAQLELEIEERLLARIDLWDKHDYSLAELAEVVDREAADGNADGAGAAVKGER